MELVVEKLQVALVDAMHSWKHSGFSAHTAVRVIPEESKTAERVIRYFSENRYPRRRP